MSCDPFVSARTRLMEVYYAQRARETASLEPADFPVRGVPCTGLGDLGLEGAPDDWRAFVDVTDRDGTIRRAHIDHAGLFRVEGT